MICDRNVEILAPAGSVASMQASFKAGADAVYMGTRSFGARAYADNPDIDEYTRALDYAHMHGKRIYLTINTVVKEDELPVLRDMLIPLYNAGLDAVIVQDMGVLNMVAKEFPLLPIHISTQAGVTGCEAAKFYPENVTRIVPARELTLSQIKDLKKTGLETEVFVHGALCYSYSGRCLFSSMCGDRSGNRGRCAQPCRKQYEAFGEKTYLLSPADICTIDRIPDLVEAGIDSFKIEGRMKSPEYAAYASAAYKNALNLYLAEGRDGFEKYIGAHENEWNKTRTGLLDLFNRGGFSEGYAFTAPGPKMMAVKRPNHEGVKVGETVIRKGFVNFKSEVSLNKGDVLCVRLCDGGLGPAADFYDYTLGEGYGNNISFRAVAPKYEKKCEGRRVEIYRIKNACLLNEINEKYVNTSDDIKVSGRLVLSSGEPAVFEVSTTEENAITGRNYSVSVNGPDVLQAKNAPLKADDVSAKLARSSGSGFEFSELTCDITGNVFLPKSALGELRRTALENLGKIITEDFKREYKVLSPGFIPNESEHNSLGRLKGVSRADYISTSDRQTETPGLIIVPFTASQLSAISCDCDIAVDLSAPIACEHFNTIIGSRGLFLISHRIYEEEDYNKIIASYSVIKGIFVRNPELLAGLCEYKNLHPDFPEIITDGCLYTANSEAAMFFAEHGVGGSVISAELSGREINRLIAGTVNEAGNTEASEYDFFLDVYGRTELMISRQCVRKTSGFCLNNLNVKNNKGVKIQAAGNDGINELFTEMKDGEGSIFPVYTDCKTCRNVVFDRSPVNLLENTDEIKKMGIAGLRIRLTTETPDEVRKLTKAVSENGFAGERNPGHFDKGVL